MRSSSVTTGTSSALTNWYLEEFTAQRRRWSTLAVSFATVHVMAAWRGQHVGAQLVEHFKS
jgi:hypothetical protein